MFGKAGVFSGGGDRVDTIIGKDTRFKGTLQAIATLRIDGHFEGEIDTQGDVFIGEGGIAKATIKARNCIVSGEISGDIVVEQKLEIASTGKIVGNIKCENLIIGEGAVFSGICEMRCNNAGEQQLP